MKDNSFAMAIAKIVGQAEAEQGEGNPHSKACRGGWPCSKRVCFLFIVTIFVFEFCYREQIQNAIFSKPSTQLGGQTSAAINAAYQYATTRDIVVNSITKQFP
jgi:hypothetical protein